MQSTIAFLPNMGPLEIGLVAGLFILFFGAKKLPELARGVGKSIKEFKKATNNVEEEIRTAIHEEDKPATPPPAAKKEQTPAE